MDRDRELCTKAASRGLYRDWQGRSTARHLIGTTGISRILHQVDGPSGAGIVDRRRCAYLAVHLVRADIHLDGWKEQPPDLG